MLRKKWFSYVLVSFFTLSFLGGCMWDSQNENQEEESGGNAAGIMLAGEEQAEVSGVVKKAQSEDEIIITVKGEDVVYRLSEDAKMQMENSGIKSGSDVTFITYTIGDDKETIAEFLGE